MRLRRWLLGALGALAFIALVLVSGLWWLYSTEPGARFVAGKLLAATGGALSVETIGGSLRESLELGGVRYADAAQTISIDTVAIRLGLSGLLTGAIAVEDLRSSVVEYRATGQATETSGAAGAGPVSVPVRLSFGRVSIAGIRVERDGAEPVVVDRVMLSGFVAGSQVALQRLETTWQGFFLSSQGNASWDDGFSLDGIVSWSGRYADRSWLGSVGFAGSWPEFRIDEELLEPFSQTASGTIRLTEAPEFDLRLAASGIGEVVVAGRYAPAEALLELAIAGSEIAPGSVVDGWPGTLALDGTVSARLGSDYRVTTDDLAVTATVGEEALVLDLAGAFDANGTVTLERLEAALGQNRIRLEGTIGQTLDVALAAELDDLSRLAATSDALALDSLNRFAEALAALHGRASAMLAISGTPDAPRVEGEIAVADATLVDLPFALRSGFSVAWPGEFLAGLSTSALPELRLDAFETSLGATRLSASGTVGAGALGPGGDAAAIDLVLRGRFDDLGELAALSARADVQALTGLESGMTALAGNASIDARLTGTRAAPRLTAGARFGELAAGLPWTAQGRLDASAELVDGGRADLTLAATTEAFDLDFVAAGTLADGGWRGQIRGLEIDERVLGVWMLDRPAAVALAPGRITLDAACLINAGSEVCAEWRHGGTDDGLRLQSDSFELATLDPLLPEIVTLGGRVAVDVRLDSLTALPAGSLRIRGSDLSLDFDLSETETVTTAFETVSIDAELASYGLTLEAALTSPTAGRARIAMQAADVRDRAAPVSGRVEIFWPDLGVLSLLSPDIGEVGGTLNVAIELSGTADEPALAGTAALREGRIAIPEWDVLVERIEAEALSFDGGTLEFSGSGFIAESEVTLSGTTALDPEAGWPTRLTLSGENVAVSQRPDAIVYASPQFDVAIDLPRIDVSGSVFVPEAMISVEELPAQAVRISSDSVVHGMTEVEAVRPLDLTADVTVELGDNVHYTGSNLSTNLSGTLRLQYESGLSPTASGTVRLEGTYDAYGQSLELARGELLFAGPLDDPALDVRAVRRIGSTTVGVDLTGTLLAPSASMFSEPAMSDANALSYLMFGRPLSPTSDDEEAATLESTALALGLQQALPGIQRVGETIGLDELSIAATDVDAGALMAGKYLSPKLYMSYTYGLFNRLGGFLLRYEINNRFALETRSGSEKSMDLLYSIEKE